MEIAITLPTETIPRVEELARKFGVSINELCVQAINRFLESHGESEITRRLNELYEHEDSSPDPVMTQLQFETLDQEEWK
jgi:predicted transcriptional regulator